MADHSQAPVTDTIALQDELAELGVLGPVALLRWRRIALRGEPRIAVCPSQRAAMVYALHEAERDAMRASVVARALAIDGVDLVHVARARRPRRAPRGRHREPAPRRAALLPRADARRAIRAGRAGASTARSTVIDAQPCDDGRLLTPVLPGRARPRVVGAHLPHLRRGAAVRRPRLRVHRLGSPGARRRRQPRLAARVGLARCARALRRRAARSPSPRSGRSATSRRSCCVTSASIARGRSRSCTRRAPSYGRRSTVRSGSAAVSPTPSLSPDASHRLRHRGSRIALFAAIPAAAAPVRRASRPLTGPAASSQPAAPARAARARRRSRHHQLGNAGAGGGLERAPGRAQAVRRTGPRDRRPPARRCARVRARNTAAPSAAPT